MNLLILDQAKQDLIDGYRFYENQGVGLGDYFLDSAYAEVDSLLGCVWEINQPIAEALRARMQGHWAGVALGGTARWAASTSVALAEHPFSLALARFISQIHPNLRGDSSHCGRVSPASGSPVSFRGLLRDRREHGGGVGRGGLPA